MHTHIQTYQRPVSYMKAQETKCASGLKCTKLDLLLILLLLNYPLYAKYVVLAFVPIIISYLVSNFAYLHDKEAVFVLV